LSDTGINSALSELALPLVIVTAGEGRDRAGLTACWLTQVSWRPPYIGVAIYYKWRTLEVIHKYREFAIHLVSRELVPAAVRVFGGMSSRKVDKFSLVEREYGITVRRGRKIRAPIIADAPIIIECKLKEHYVVGDHHFLICDPMEAYSGRKGEVVTCYRGVPYMVGSKVEL
jgi:flavin reductase (DIM6/NTAB) family NADH-FMN oxidoreductase RutF